MGGLPAEGETLDYRETVDALDQAVQGQLGEALAEDLAAGFARAGLVLVRLTDNTGLTRPGQEAATSWFGREEDV